MRPLLFLMLLQPLVGAGQELFMDVLPTIDGEPTYRDTAHVDTVRSSELLHRAVHFLKGRYRHCIVSEDTTAKAVEVRGAMSFYWQHAAGSSVMAYAGHTLRVECKDGRYRYTISEICIAYQGDGDEYGALRGACHDVVVWNQGRLQNKKKALVNVHVGLSQLIADLKLHMSQPVQLQERDAGAKAPASVAPDDW